MRPARRAYRAPGSLQGPRLAPAPSQTWPAVVGAKQARFGDRGGHGDVIAAAAGGNSGSPAVVMGNGNTAVVEQEDEVAAQHRGIVQPLKGFTFGIQTEPRPASMYRYCVFLSLEPYNRIVKSRPLFQYFCGFLQMLSDGQMLRTMFLAPPTSDTGRGFAHPQRSRIVVVIGRGVLSNHSGNAL